MYIKKEELAYASLTNNIARKNAISPPMMSLVMYVYIYRICIIFHILCDMVSFVMSNFNASMQSVEKRTILEKAYITQPHYPFKYKLKLQPRIRIKIIFQNLKMNLQIKKYLHFTLIIETNKDMYLCFFKI